MQSPAFMSLGSQRLGRPPGGGRPGLRRDVDPPIGKPLAEIALIAGIPGGWPALRRNIGPMPIGGSLAETAGTAETPATLQAFAVSRTRNQFSPVILRTFAGVVMRPRAAMISG